jgi:hypothetical protein
LKQSLAAAQRLGRQSRHALGTLGANVADAGHEYASLRRQVLGEVDAVLDLCEPFACQLRVGR